MAKSLSILYVSSEVFPFAKVGGIGDVAYSLPIAIREAGHDIRVMMPKYGIVSERRNKIHEINRLRDMEIPIGDSVYYATVKSSSMNNPKVKVQAYISTNQNFFDAKKGIYADVKTGIDFPNNDERFAFFSKSVVETCNMLGWVPDIIHCNDWQTGLVAAFAKIFHPKKFAKTKFILTIHNMAFQGEYPAENFDKLMVPESEKDNFIHNGKLNFLKAGIIYADAVNTVSETYHNEILQDTNYSNGLNDLLMDEQKKFVGILNGVDTYAWNPKTDQHLNQKLEEDITEYKDANKEFILQQFGLPIDLKTPLIGLITRLNEKKGMDILVEALPTLLKQKVNIVLLGDGDAKYKELLKEIYKNNFEKFAFKFANDEVLTHKMEAGCDFFLLPSKQEPCGLNVMYSLKYGTIPIVHNVGGMCEIVQEFDPETGEGNGFKFNEFTSDALVNSVKEALKFYRNKKGMTTLIEKVMESDFSWNESLKQYLKMYTTMLKEKV